MAIEGIEQEQQGIIEIREISQEDIIARSLNGEDVSALLNLFADDERWKIERAIKLEIVAKSINGENIEPYLKHISDTDRYFIEREIKAREEKKEGRPRKSRSHSDIIWNYFNSKDRQHYRSGHNVFFEYDTLYSYGHHFTLAVETRYGKFVINADKYSVSTSGHTSICIGEAPEGTPQIPFSALNRADVNPKNIDIIDKTKDTYETRRVKDPKTGELKTIEIHHLGACLFRDYGNFYLSSLDQHSRTFQYYLVKLRHGVDSVEEAYKEISGLTEEEYKRYEQEEIKRQGEYFFIPVGSTAELKELMKQNGIKPVLKPKYEILFGGEWIRHGNLEKGIDLGHRIYHNAPSNNPHIARDYVDIASLGVFVRGTVRHPEHNILKLGEVWHRVTLNDVVNSWSATGRVD